MAGLEGVAAALDFDLNLGGRIGFDERAGEWAEEDLPLFFVDVELVLLAATRSGRRRLHELLGHSHAARRVEKRDRLQIEFLVVLGLRKLNLAGDLGSRDDPFGDRREDRVEAVELADGEAKATCPLREVLVPHRRGYSRGALILGHPFGR